MRWGLIHSCCTTNSDHGSVYSHESKDSVYDHDEKAGEKLKHEVTNGTSPPKEKKKSNFLNTRVYFA